jgi:hypothetical protein
MDGVPKDACRTDYYSFRARKCGSGWPTAPEMANGVRELGEKKVGVRKEGKRERNPK